jgi:hypothetical protein
MASRINRWSPQMSDPTPTAFLNAAGEALKALTVDGLSSVSLHYTTRSPMPFTVYAHGAHGCSQGIGYTAVEAFDEAMANTVREAA